MEMSKEEAQEKVDEIRGKYLHIEHLDGSEFAAEACNFVGTLDEVWNHWNEEHHKGEGRPPSISCKRLDGSCFIDDDRPSWSEPRNYEEKIYDSASGEALFVCNKQKEIDPSEVVEELTFEAKKNQNEHTKTEGED